MQVPSSLPLDPSAVRILFIHAHPDDESIFTGGTIAQYAQLGAKIMILTCTLGEEGEVMLPELTGLVAQDGADQLGGYRYQEMQNAISAFNQSAPYPVQHAWLGGVGAWRDSGMDWLEGCTEAEKSAAQEGNFLPENLHPAAFVQGAYNLEKFKQQISQLQEEIEVFQPTHIISYDAQGIYGHPDHIQVHKLCRSVMTRLPAPIPELWEVTLEPQITAMALEQVPEETIPDDWIMPDVISDMTLGDNLPDNPDYIRIMIGDYVDIQRTALEAHRSQLTVHAKENIFILTNRIVQPFGYMESYHKIEPGVCAEV